MNPLSGGKVWTKKASAVVTVVTIGIKGEEENCLVDLIYPDFQISKLLQPPKHGARGKKYVRK